MKPLLSLPQLCLLTDAGVAATDNGVAATGAIGEAGGGFPL